ncbi:hypothetical protein M8J77_008057 [Diaphorina citri]|nr:hypothetical protein M8J77_008057 [Diaphorina citri]
MAKEWRENDTLMTIKENNSKTNKEDSKKGVKRLKIRRFGPCTTDPCHSCIKEKKSDPCQFYSRGMRDNSDPNCNKNSKSPLPGTSREANDCTMPVDMKEERVRKTVDKLLKSFNRSDCCLRCPDQNPRLPCESFRHLLKFVESGGPTVPRVCRQSGREYEKDIVDEIKRRMRLGLCGNITAPRPALDYVAVPKKKVLRKKTPPKVEKEPKPTKKKPPKPKPKSIVPPRIVFLAPKNFKIDDTPAAAGTVQYRLSDPCFIAKGWTKLPPSRDEMYKTFYTFQAEPCGPLLDSKVWKTKQSFRFYPNGQLMARIERDGTIQVFYPNCDNDLAIHVKPSGPVHYRVVVYFNKDEYLKDRRNQLPNKSLPAAIFDSYGNGVVYDTKGKIRLKYDQAEGKLLDFPPSKACCPLQPVIHPPLHWRVTAVRTKTPTSDDEKAFEDDLDMSKFQTSVSIANGASSVQLKDVASIYNDSRVASPKPPSNSSDRSAALLSKRSISPANKVQKSKWASKRKLRHRNATARFDVCASDVQLDDPVFVRETGKSVETPVRLVLRIENGVSLIMFGVAD